MSNCLKKCFKRISKPNENLSFKKMFYPIYSVITYFGLFPYSVKFQKTKRELTIIPKSIYVNSLYGVSIILTVYLFLTLHVREVFLTSESDSTIDAILTQSNYILELIILIIVITVTYICAFLNRRNYVKILNTIISTWNELPKNYKSQCILRRVHFKVHVIVNCCLFLAVVMQLCVNFTRDDSVWKMILVSMSFNLPQTVQFLTIAFYYIVVMMLIALLTNLKEHLIELRINKLKESSGFVKIKTLHSLTLRQMELVYTKAFQAKKNINKAFQGPLLVSTLQCFHAIVSEAHIIYHGLSIKKSLTVHEMLNCSVWIVYQLAKIFAIASSGNALKMEVIKIGQTLHDIPTERRDVRWFMEIQHFSALIKYQNIELNLYGCFPLDARFLYNMLGTMTMYLIILVQLDKKE